MSDIAPEQLKLFSEKWWIPGMGEASPTCGQDDWITLKCSSGQAGHDHEKIVHSCKRLNCPICHDEGAWREAFKATERFDGIKAGWRDQGRDLRHLVHIVTSPPPDEIFDDEDLNRSRSRSIIREIGGVGGADVFHPYRGSEKVMDRIRHREITAKPSPHYHGLYFLPDRPDDHLFDAEQIEEIHQRTGWVIKILPREIRKGDRAGQYFNVVNKIHYELTHCGIESTHQNRHTLRWWGICAYNNVKSSIEKIEEEHLCSKCGAPVHRYSINEEIIKPGVNAYSVELDEWIHQDPEIIQHEVDEGPHMIIRKIRHYWIDPARAARIKIKLGRQLGLEIITAPSIGVEWG